MGYDAGPGSRPELIGRARELTALRGALDGGVRIVTILGAGGVGKTTVARAFVSQTDSWAIFCDLSAARDRMDVATSIARALSLGAVQSIDARSVEESIVAGLRRAEDRVGCVVLDNAEHVSGAVAEVLRGLLPASPKVRFVVTSRAPLDIADERTVVLAPLSCEPPRDGGLSDAALLLRLRVQQAQLTPDAWNNVEDARWNALAQSLEGFPLALELAASAIVDLGLGAVERRVPVLLNELESTHRDAPQRLRSLKASFDWSWELLSPEEAAALSRLSVFPGELSLDGGACAIGGSPAAALTQLRTLVRKSMLRVSDSASSRFVLYSSVRQLAAAKLDDAAFRETALRIGAELAARVDQLTFPAMDSLEAMRAAALGDGENVLRWAELGLRDEAFYPHAAVLGRALIMDGLVKSVGRAFELVCGLCEHPSFEALSSRTRGNLLLARSRLASFVGTPESCIAACQAARATLPQDAYIERALLGRWGAMSLARLGRMDEAAAELERAFGAYVSANDAAGQLETHSSLLQVELLAGRYDSVAERLSRLSVDTAPAPVRARIALAAAALGLVRRDEAEVQRWTSLAEASARELGSPLYLALALGFCAVPAYLQGRFDLVERLVHESSEAAREIAFPQIEVNTVLVAAALAFERGDLDGATRAVGRAHALSTQACATWFGRFSVTMFEMVAFAAIGDAAGVQRAIAQARLETAGLPAWVSTVLDGARALVAIAERRISTLRCVEPIDPGIHEGLERIASAPDEMGRIAAAAARAVLSWPPPPIALNRQGGCWRLGGTTEIDLSKQPLLARLLEKLAEAARETPGKSVPSDVLVAIGWPDDRAKLSSLRLRLRVAFTRLRKAGLGDLLVSDETGYRLHDAVRVSSRSSHPSGYPLATHGERD